MNIPKTSILIALVAVLLAPAVLNAQRPGRKSDITGTVFDDKNRNGQFDEKEMGAKGESTVWLYVTLKGGIRKRVDRMQTNDKGEFVFKNMPPGRYFIATRFQNKFAVRTKSFEVNGNNRLKVYNIPLVNKRTVGRYNFLSETGNPENLDDQGDVSQSAP